MCGRHKELAHSVRHFGLLLAHAVLVTDTPKGDENGTQVVLKTKEAGGHSTPLSQLTACLVAVVVVEVHGGHSFADSAGFFSSPYS